ncbi:hypothetical protein GCM10027079_21090 [Sediminivirga luteola]|uniref:Uncharacterized protein n=1 Tax=Sediminivirga luteola TaxID=1774748 RepID=A0A8J2XJT5_9MICO|nr:hypothetical protein GCM10011333_08510 [Sediminivirga luteola]
MRRYWAKHPKKELEALLGEFHEAGWRIENPKRKYYRVKCPCGEHKKSVHISPSDPNYVKNTLSWLYRQPCYQEGRR